MDHKVVWPDGKQFAFTIFDDPDGQTLAQSRETYTFLDDLGVRTTAGVWVLEPGEQRRNSGGETCANSEYRAWMQELQTRGFEIGLHCVAPASMAREEIARGLDDFRAFFGGDPFTMANHYNADALYWGPARLTGMNRVIYEAVTLRRLGNRFFGDREGHPSFWGDLCRARIRYCRNFVFRELNTLKVCPWMPYADPERPYVPLWYASAEASNLVRFLERVTDPSMDRLEEEGGAAILYTHFGHGFSGSGTLDGRFKRLMARLAKKNGWFVPVGTLLRYLESQGNGKFLAASDRDRMERRWLWTKLRYGTS